MKQLTVLFTIITLAIVGYSFYSSKAENQKKVQSNINQFLKVDRVLVKTGITDVNLNTDQKSIILLSSKGRGKFLIFFEPFCESSLNQFNELAEMIGSTSRIRYLPKQTALEIYNKRLNYQDWLWNR